MLPQNFSSFDRITVRESLRTTRGCSAARADIDALMDLTNLRDKADAPGSTRSPAASSNDSGSPSRSSTTRRSSFSTSPRPDSTRTPGAQVWDVLKGLKDRGKTVFLTTHYMEEAELLADTVAIIAQGPDRRHRLAGAPHRGSMPTRCG